MKKRKQVTFVTRINEYGEWLVYTDGKLMRNPEEFILRLVRDRRTNKRISNITLLQDTPRCEYVDDEYVEVILHQIDKENNTERTERLC